MRWHSAWTEYVRGHVVSVTAAALIQSFLLKTLAASGGNNDDDAQSEKDKSEDETDIPPLRLSPSSLKDVLAPPGHAPCAEASSGDEKKGKTTGAKMKQSLNRKFIRSDYDQSIKTGNAVWATPEIDVAVEDRKAPGHMCEDNVVDILNAKRASGQKSETDQAPFDVDRHAACTWSRLEAEITVESTFMSSMAGREHPNAERIFWNISFGD